MTRLHGSLQPLRFQGYPPLIDLHTHKSRRPLHRLQTSLLLQFGPRPITRKLTRYSSSLPRAAPNLDQLLARSGFTGTLIGRTGIRLRKRSKPRLTRFLKHVNTPYAVPTTFSFATVSSALSRYKQQPLPPHPLPFIRTLVASLARKLFLLSPELKASVIH